MSISASPPAPTAEHHFEVVRLDGHILDSLILPKILDIITRHGGSFRVKEMEVGQARDDASHARIEVHASSEPTLQDILRQIVEHGAVALEREDCKLLVAESDGALPEGFYSTTNEPTEVRLRGRWTRVAKQEMDCGIVVRGDCTQAICIPMTEVRRGDLIVTGRSGVRVITEDRPAPPEEFAFMGSDVSTEKPKSRVIREIAQHLADNRPKGDKTLLVAGPAVVHTGSGPHLARLIREGHIDILFAGNALAAHDIEQALFGTSLGVPLDGKAPSSSGHEHHLRAINRIRRCGGIREAVHSGVLTSGIMFECVQRGIDFLLAGSIRDDGPLPDVVTDVMEAQRRMRRLLPEVTFCLMMATTLHSVATGNLLPSWVRVVCVDINPSTAIKLSDRGTRQTTALVTDVAPFLRELSEELRAIPSRTA